MHVLYLCSCGINKILPENITTSKQAEFFWYLYLLYVPQCPANVKIKLLKLVIHSFLMTYQLFSWYFNIFSPPMLSHYTWKVHLLITLTIIAAAKFKRLLEDHR